MRGQLCILGCIVGLVQSSVLPSLYLGHEIVMRSSKVELGRAVLIFKNLQPGAGNITAFHAFFVHPSQGLFQVWRPHDSADSAGSMVEFSLFYERPGSLTRQGAKTFALDADEQVAIEDGDVVGYLHEHDTLFPITASFTPSQPSNMFIASIYNDDELPRLGQVISTNFIQYPYFFSIGITFTPSKASGGVRGDPGATGATGRQGQPGPPGRIGHVGPIGPTGVTGATGKRGAAGDAGPTGATGATGLVGTHGATGETGPQGPIGGKGDGGLSGPQGPMGQSGATGATGVYGATGATGIPGRIGATGATGQPGLHGEGGEQGPPGPIGSKGDKGDKGEIGPVGLVGPPGPRGLIYEDVDECQRPGIPCQHICVNDVGSYHCTCRRGYSLSADGFTCTDVNECGENNGGCQGVCSNQVGGHSCSCPTGLLLSANNHDCQDVSECASNRGSCDADELCVETYGGYHCLSASDQIPDPDLINQDASDARGPRTKAVRMQSVEIPEDNLVNRRVVMGLLIWLTILSTIHILVLLAACLRKLKSYKGRKFYLNYDLHSPISPATDDRKPSSSSVLATPSHPRL